MAKKKAVKRAKRRRVRRGETVMPFGSSGTISFEQPRPEKRAKAAKQHAAAIERARKANLRAQIVRLGDNIKLARIKHNGTSLGLTAAARQVGLTRAQFREVEAGDRMLSNLQFQKLSELFGVSVYQIKTGTDVLPPKPEPETPRPTRDEVVHICSIDDDDGVELNVFKRNFDDAIKEIPEHLRHSAAVTVRIHPYDEDTGTYDQQLLALTYSRPMSDEEIAAQAKADTYDRFERAEYERLKAKFG